MPTPFALPSWLQYVVAASSIISSLGVVVALVQIAIAKNQFKTQLAVTTNQFTLLNQGYLNLDTRSSLYSPQLVPGTPMRSGVAYESIAIEASLENVGNTPIIYRAESIKMYFNDVEVYSAPTNSLGSSISYPKQKSTFGMGTAFFTQQHSLLTIAQIQQLHPTCKFKFSYHDFNSNHTKTIERTLVVTLTEHGTGGTYVDIMDQL
jgi:hypothetical protein